MAPWRVATRKDAAPMRLFAFGVLAVLLVVAFVHGRRYRILMNSSANPYLRRTYADTLMGMGFTDQRGASCSI
jgi:hypothetical protein